MRNDSCLLSGASPRTFARVVNRMTVSDHCTERALHDCEVVGVDRVDEERSDEQHRGIGDQRQMARS